MGNGNAPGGGSAPGGGIIPGGGGGNIPGGGMWGTCGGAVEVAWYAAAVKESQIKVRKMRTKELKLCLKHTSFVSLLAKS